LLYGLSYLFLAKETTGSPCDLSRLEKFSWTKTSHQSKIALVFSEIRGEHWKSTFTNEKRLSYNMNQIFPITHLILKKARSVNQWQ